MLNRMMRIMTVKREMAMPERGRRKCSIAFLSTSKVTDRQDGNIQITDNRNADITSLCTKNPNAFFKYVVKFFVQAELLISTGCRFFKSVDEEKQSAASNRWSETML
jgi:hypothetical protein